MRPDEPPDEFPEGIICYLTRKHGGNVHKNGVATLTVKSVDKDAQLSWVADVVDGKELCTEDSPPQWVCWDFHEMRVRPTLYVVDAYWMKSWVAESSVDGENWTE
jgi:hypothetical protein